MDTEREEANLRAVAEGRDLLAEITMMQRVVESLHALYDSNNKLRVMAHQLNHDLFLARNDARRWQWARFRLRIEDVEEKNKFDRHFDEELARGLDYHVDQILTQAAKELN